MNQQFKVIMFCIVSAVLLFASCSNSGNKTDTTSQNEAHAHDDKDHHEHIFACPMHPDVTGHEGDKCPKCGMPLEHMDIKPTAGNFKMEFSSSPHNIEAGKEVTLSFTPKNSDNATAAVPLDIQHEKKIHLIVVSEDLSWFLHIHPEYQSNGSFNVNVTFPSGGNYILYVDYKPSGGTHQLEKIPVQVQGKENPSLTYSAPKNTASSAPYSVTLTPDDAKFISNKAIHFDGVFSKNGKPFDVNQLQNYLGAKGHMVAIHTETKEYVHLHPEVEGSILHFHTTFEKAGIYRVWLQFLADGQIHTTDFVINVEQGDSTSQAGNKDTHNHSH